MTRLLKDARRQLAIGRRGLLIPVQRVVGLLWRGCPSCSVSAHVPAQRVGLLRRSCRSCSGSAFVPAQRIGTQEAVLRDQGLVPPGPGGRVAPLRRFLFRWVLRLVVTFLALTGICVALVAVSVWYVARQDDRPRSDAIVVLGASQFDGRPSEVLRARLDHAKRLYDTGVAPRVLTVGGGQPEDRFTEGGTGKRYLVRRGLPARSVLAVEEGHDTRTSLQAVNRVFREQGWHTAVLVTDPWHSLRSRTMAEDLGIRSATSPTRQGPAVRTREYQVRSITRETLGYLYYRLFDLQQLGS